MPDFRAGIEHVVGWMGRQKGDCVPGTLQVRGVLKFTLCWCLLSGTVEEQGWGWGQGLGPMHIPMPLVSADTLVTISSKLAPASAMAPATCKEASMGEGCPHVTAEGHCIFTHLVHEDSATQPAAPSFLLAGEGAVIAHHHHPYIGALCPCPLQCQPKVQAVPGIVLHDQQRPHCEQEVKPQAHGVPMPHSVIIPAPAAVTARMAARMLPTAGEVKTAPATTPLSMPFPM